MFYGKKIKKLEERVAILEEKVCALTDAISVHGELDYLKKKMKDLIAFDNQVSLDPVCFDLFLENKNEEEREFYTKCKEGYEKRLRRFIRSVTSKKKMVTKVVNDGKEKPGTK